MTKRSCEDVRRELDEVMLGDECSSAATDHLRDCPACSEFEQKQTKLRQIVGSLGVVQAPPDFDFRLRARLANESSSGVYHLKTAYWSVGRSAATAFAALVLFVGGYFMVRHFTTAPANPEVVKQTPKPAELPPDVRTPNPEPSKSPEPEQIVKLADERQKIARHNLAPQRRRLLASLESSSTVAPVFGRNSTEIDDAAVFPIDASQQTFRFSLDDGRGNARTISLPRVTFGSQRVLATGNQLGPKGVW